MDISRKERTLTTELLTGRGVCRINMGRWAMRKLDRITIDAKVFEGQLCIGNMRIPVSLIVKLVSAGKTADEIISNYPELKKEDINQALEFARRLF